MCYNSTPVHTEQYAGFKIEIWHDEYAPNPAENDCIAGEYTIFKSRNFREMSSVKNPISRDEFTEKCESGEMDNYVVFIFDLDSRAGLSAVHIRPERIRTIDEGSTFDGVWFMSFDEIVKEWGNTPTILPEGTFTPYEMAVRYGKAFLQEMDDYYMGNVYGYKVLDSEGEEVDSCWGFIGNYDGYILQEAKSVCEHEAKRRAEAEQFAGKFMCC